MVPSVLLTFIITSSLLVCWVQVRKLIGKVVSRESFHYRRLTDMPMAKEGEPAPDRNLLPFDLETIARGQSQQRIRPLL
jgi:hypothetical protein